MKLDEQTQKLQEKKLKQDEVKKKNNGMNKKKLTQEQRIARIEEILGIE